MASLRVSSCSGLNTSSEESVGNVAALSGQRCDHLWRKSIQWCEYSLVLILVYRTNSSCKNTFCSSVVHSFGMSYKCSAVIVSSTNHPAGLELTGWYLWDTGQTLAGSNYKMRAEGREWRWGEECWRMVESANIYSTCWCIDASFESTHLNQQILDVITDAYPVDVFLSHLIQQILDAITGAYPVDASLLYLIQQISDIMHWYVSCARVDGSLSHLSQQICPLCVVRVFYIMQGHTTWKEKLI